MGLTVASALISIRGGHWPRLARLLSDWLRSRQPLFDFRVERPVARALPPCPEGPGARGGARRAGGGVPQVRLPVGLAGGGGTPERPRRLPSPTTPAAPSAVLTSLALAAQPTFRRPGPGLAVTCPQVASRDKEESNPPGTPLSPRSAPRALR